jgi:hypothetical protein
MSVASGNFEVPVVGGLSHQSFIFSQGFITSETFDQYL